MYGQIPYMIPNAVSQIAPSAGALSSASTLGHNGFKLSSLLSKINLSSILSNAQKTLNVVNQAIPLYYQIKPVFKNIKTLGKIGKEFTKINSVNEKEIKNEDIKENINENKTSQNNIDDYPNPTFFL
ncbi:MAG TPA: hypothetical protein IAB68_06050 [Candidatus Aphodocola excrementigallinarum]|uniref:Uncharacterized protein n=1 Tax=Candidatus Aphodocola excrementigallinarum TaxID=2840670 RepID=A0A9D1INY5_9FIRM|nr:hypothetical protein [Candidatus Aphodocola excrementigallinarum]